MDFDNITFKIIEKPPPPKKNLLSLDHNMCKIQGLLIAEEISTLLQKANFDNSSEKYRSAWVKLADVPNITNKIKHAVNLDSEKGYNMAGYFPQATRNYLLGLTLGF